MKKSIFLSAIVIAIALIYGFRQSGQNKLAEKNPIQALRDEAKGNNIPVVNEAGSESEFVNHEVGSSLLLLLANYKKKDDNSPSFLHEYLYGKTGRPGC